jgi:tetraacyldisaccharide 4'-kinase
MRWLAPLGAVYGALGALRVKAYRSGLLSVTRLQGPVISVGNLSVGGSGKTPVVARLAEMLLEAGLPVSILSRGYRGAFRGEFLVVSDGHDVLAGAELAGDEPVMLARALPAAVVAVGPRRDVVGRAVEARFGPRVHLLDDGFQHLRLHRDLDLLCIEPRDLDDAPLPAGRLREWPSAQRRADMLLRVRRTVLGFFGVDGRPQPAPLTPWLVSAIARPERFEADARQSAPGVAGVTAFRDHHVASSIEWAAVVARARAAGADALVTTAKDAVRLPADPGPLPVLVLRIAIAIDGEAALRARVLAVARRAA